MESRDSKRDMQEQPSLLVITRVEPLVKKPGQYDIYLNGEYAFTVREDTVVALRLLKGAQLDQADLNRIEEEERVFKALDRAIRWIARRPHAASEVERKLRQLEIEEPTIDAVLQRLDKQGLIDDRTFAAQWAEHRIHRQGKGRHWVRHELMQKGVAKSDIDAALGQVDQSAEFDQALRLGLKKWRQSKGEQLVRKHKTAAYLMRRGYPSELVKEVVRQCSEEDYDVEF